VCDSLRERDILEWGQGCQTFEADLFFSLKIISFYTIIVNKLKRERERVGEENDDFGVNIFGEIGPKNR
jgi:hypothetical protein